LLLVLVNFRHNNTCEKAARENVGKLPKGGYNFDCRTVVIKTTTILIKAAYQQQQ